MKLRKFLSQWRQSHNNHKKKSQHYSCKIVGITFCPESYKTQLSVLIIGIKRQIITYSPKELVINDKMIGEFSPMDVRAITFYALKEISDFISPVFKIVGQELSNQKTVFRLHHILEDKYLKRSAAALYRDIQLLELFNRNDLINVITTAIQEQTMDDLDKMSTQE